MRVSSFARLSTCTALLVLAGCSDAHLNQPPLVADLAVSVMEDTTTTAMIDVTDPDRDGLLIELADPPTHGVATIADMTITYTPEADYNGDDALTFTVYDTKNPRETAAASITVLPVNDAPVGVADAIAAIEDTARTIAASALLQNDTDIDGDTLTISAVAAATHGTVALSGTDVVFTPDVDFVGEGSFEYTLDDGTATVTVAVTVDIGGENDAPVATNDTATTAEDTPIDLMTLLANDTDTDGQTLTIDSALAGTNGTVGVSGDIVTFTPAADFNGTATFTYVVTDGVATDTGTVTVTVTPVNDAPVATGDTATIDEDTPTTFTTLTTNDSDVDLDTLTISAVDNANNGTVALNGGQPIFTPTADYNGAASFDYTVSDGAGGTATGSVTITVSPVNDPPVAVDDADSTAEDTPITFTTLADNDTDIELDTLSVTAVANPMNGTVALDGGNPIFTPAADFFGTASFDYTVSDGNGGTDTGTVTVTVAAEPDVTSVTPAAVSVEANGGTAILTVTIDAAAGPGGVQVELASSATADLAVPTNVTVPEGATSIGFRVRADATGAAGPITVTASLAGTSGTATSAATVVTSVAAPAVGDLVINEINYDVLAGSTDAGDANCDGISDPQDDEFVEISNLSASPVQMQTVSLWDGAAFSGTTPVYSFPAFVLGAGETVVVFSGAVGTTGTNVWCTNLDGSHIGDARAFGAGKSFALNNTTGDTVHLTANATVSSTELVTAVAVPTTSSKQAFARDPDFIGAFVKDGPGVGAADRNWSPGTLITGEPFAAASP
jgi:hypothetical protein